MENKIALFPHYGKPVLQMGILNLTPDSFSDGGRFNAPECALEQALQLQAAGADWIDVGTESTRPGYSPVSTKEQLARLLPVLEAVTPHLTVPFSIDTTDVAVAQAAVDFGCAMLNDVSGLQDGAMLDLAVAHNLYAVLMHGVAHVLEPDDGRAAHSVADWLAGEAARCIAHGLRPEQLVVDPGFGFGTTRQQEVDMLANLNVITALPYPVLVGISRKRVTRFLYPDVPPDEATALISMKLPAQKVSILRTHRVVRF